MSATIAGHVATGNHRGGDRRLPGGLGGAIARSDTTTELRLFADLDAVIRWRVLRAARLTLIAEHFPDAPRHLGAWTWLRSQVARDDLLDAYAVLWTALRFRRGPGQYRELGDGARDAYGLRQRIVV